MSINPVSSLPPVDPNDSGLPDWFNPDVPGKYLDPWSYPGSDIMSKLYSMIQYMQTHPSNKTAPQVFLLYLSNLSNQGVFNAHPDLLQQVMGLTVNGRSLFKFIIDLEVKQNFFDGGDKQADGSQDGTAFFNYLKSLFKGSDALSTTIRNYIDNNWMGDGGAMWQEFLSQNTVDGDGKTPIYTEDQFNVVASGQWGMAILRANVGTWQVSMRKAMINALSDLSAFKNNPLALLMMLIFLLSDSNSTIEIGGYGETSNWLKERTNDISKITSSWGDQFPSGADAKAWIDELRMLQFLTDNSPMAGNLKDLVDSQVGSVLNMQAYGSDGKPLFQPDGKTPVTIEDLAAGYTDTSGVQHDPDPAALQTALNQFMPQPGQEVPEQYNQIMNNLKSLGSAFSDQSQTVGTMTNQLSSMIQQIDNMLNKSLNGDTGIMGLMKVLVQNQTRA